MTALFFFFNVLLCFTLSTHNAFCKDKPSKCDVPLDSTRCKTDKISPPNKLSDADQKTWDDAVKASGYTTDEIKNLILIYNPYQHRVHNSAHDVMMANQTIQRSQELLNTKTVSKTDEEKIMKMIARSKITLAIAQEKYPPFPPQANLTKEEEQKIKQAIYQSNQSIYVDIYALLDKASKEKK